jgi:hypothetical protein
MGRPVRQSSKGKADGNDDNDEDDEEDDDADDAAAAAADAIRITRPVDGDSKRR